MLQYRYLIAPGGPPPGYWGSTPPVYYPQPPVAVPGDPPPTTPHIKGALVPVTTVTATIPAGQSLSDAVNCGGPNGTSQVVRVYMPDQWNEAKLSLEVSSDGIVPFRPVYTPTGYPALLTVVTGAALLIPDDLGRGLAFIKFRSGTREVPMIQSAARAFIVILQ